MRVSFWICALLVVAFPVQAETLVFARGTDDALWVRDRAAWKSLGGNLSAGPDACSWGPDRVDVFARDAELHLIQIARIGGRWTRWFNLGGSLRSAPTAVSWGPNRIDVFAAGDDQTLIHKAWNGSEWSEWESLGGQIVGSPDAASWGPGRLDVFARGTDGALWQIAWDGEGWSDWVRLGGALASDPGAVSWGPNRIDVFARKADGKMWQIAWDGSRWTRWFDQGGAFHSGTGADASSLGPDRVEVYGVGPRGDLMRKAWNGTRWGEWLSLGGAITSDPGAVVVRDTAVAVPSAPALARFRISLTGFTVNRASWDDILQRDGKGDEVFTVHEVRILGKEDTVVAAGDPVRSAVMGDINRHDWRSTRIQAGSLSEAGGLTTGDTVERSVVLWDGQLSAGGNSLLIVPTIWEWDGDPDFLNRALAFLAAPIILAGEGAGIVLGARPGPPGEQGAALLSSVVRTLTGRGDIGTNVTASKNVFGDPKDRPVGMKDAGIRYVFEPQALHFTYETALQASRTDFGRGNGVISIRYRDAEDLKGDYTLHVHIENVRP